MFADAKTASCHYDLLICGHRMVICPTHLSTPVQPPSDPSLQIHLRCWLLRPRPTIVPVRPPGILQRVQLPPLLLRLPTRRIQDYLCNSTPTLHLSITYSALLLVWSPPTLLCHPVGWFAWKLRHLACPETRWSSWQLHGPCPKHLSIPAQPPPNLAAGLSSDVANPTSTHHACICPPGVLR